MIISRRTALRSLAAALPASRLRSAIADAPGLKLRKARSRVLVTRFSGMKFRRGSVTPNSAFGPIGGRSLCPKTATGMPATCIWRAAPQYKFHVQHYGHPSKVGFKDVIAKFKADRWDPEHLMDLYKKAGAKFFVSMGVHHDNFDMWNSKYQPGGTPPLRGLRRT